MNTVEEHALIEEVAKHLPGWQYVKDQDRNEPTINGPNGMQIHINANGWYSRDGKAHIGGHWPQTSSGQYHSPRSWGAIPYGESEDIGIGVSASRGPVAIAKEITRRFLPEYIRIYNLCLEAKKRQDSHAHDVLSRAQAVADAIGQPLDNRVRTGDTDITVQLKRYSDTGWYGEARVQSKIELKLHNLTVDQVSDVIDALNKRG